MGAVNRESVAEGSLLRLVDEFAAFGPMYLKWVRSRLQDSGMTYARMRLLGALHCNGPQIMSSISDELGVTRRNVTALVDALEGEGLVRRKPRAGTVVAALPDDTRYRHSIGSLRDLMQYAQTTDFQYVYVGRVELSRALENSRLVERPHAAR